jgi:hypothetical protein
MLRQTVVGGLGRRCYAGPGYDVANLFSAATPYPGRARRRVMSLTNEARQTSISGGRRVCFFEGPDGVQLEFIEMKA